MRNDKYILDANGEPIPEPDLLKWARWYEDAVEQAFRGYMALPAPGQTSGIQWWSVLGVAINASADQVKEAYRILVAKHHPDKGGDAEMFLRVQQAWELFQKISPRI